MKESTAWSIYNNPYELEIAISEKGGLFGIVINHVITIGGKRELPKWMFVTKLFLESLEDAVEITRQILEQVLRFAHQKSVTADVFNPNLISTDQGYVLNTDLINRMIEELKSNPSKPVVHTHEMLPKLYS